MGPTRTPRTRRKDVSSIPNADDHLKVPARRHIPNKESGGAPGVQKLKSSLRQTRRLLAKDNLAADIRVGTERRLKALETELAQAETSRKERAMASRYHKVKFFERQKVVRKLTQAKKRLLSADASSKAQLEHALYELRVDLNYVIHYPKTKKYISLFPPEIRKGKDPGVSGSEKAKTDASRDHVRSWIRGCMGRGEVSSEPESHLDTRGKHDQVSSSVDEQDGQGARKKGGGTGSSRPVARVENDTFFENDDEDNSQSEDSDSES